MIHPTWLERFIQARINLRIFGRYVGTGHLFVNGRSYDTDDDTSSDDEN
jgi:hypothetical protein